MHEPSIKLPARDAAVWIYLLEITVFEFSVCWPVSNCKIVCKAEVERLVLDILAFVRSRIPFCGTGL